MLKRFFERLSLIGLIGAFPKAAFACSMLLCAVGVYASGGFLTPPTVTPQPSAIFSQANSYGSVNMGLTIPTGGPTEFPSTYNNSWTMYQEFTNSASGWLFGTGNSATFGVLTLSNLLFIKHNGGAGWWLPTVALSNGGNVTATVTHAGYNGGIYTWTAADGCSSANGAGAREPQGAVILQNNAPAASTIDPGFLCSQNSSGASPQVSFASIPGAGSQQNVTVTSCANNTPVSGEYEITATTGVAHGLSAGQSFVLSATTNFNATFVADTGTTGTTLKGISKASGTCPASTDSGTLNGGASNTITVPAITVSSMFSTQIGTGIQFKPGQRICGMFGEFGADSAFPGAQYAKYTDITGVDVPGSPAVSPWLNMGTATFTGYVVAGTQAAGTPALTVTSMNSTSISNAIYSGGDVTFTFGSNPGLTVGSEFTVSGITPSGFNQTYVAIAGTSGTTVVGNPLSGPVGLPQALSSPGGYSSGGSAVSVIMPGMIILGEAGYVAPFGAYGSTGTGGTGTYGLTANPGNTTFTGSIPSSSSTLTTASTPSPVPVPGSNLSLASPAYTGVIQTINSGSGSSGSTYTVSPANGGTAISAATISNTGALWSSGTPGTIYASEMFYNTAFTPNTASPGFSITAQTQAGGGNFMTTVGLEAAVGGALTGNNSSGWTGNIANVGMFQGAAFPMTATGQPSSTAFNQLCTKTTDPYSWATANGGSWRSLYKLNDPGIWADHSLAEFTGSASGTALTISTTQFGSTSALPTGASGAVISGPGLCANSACPHVVSGSGTSYTLSSSVGTISSEAMTAGDYQPLSPLTSQQVTASISGSTLTVTAAGGTATSSFTGTYAGTNTANNLTTSAPTGTIAQAQCVWDGGVNIQQSNPLCITGGATTSWTVNTGTTGFNYYNAAFGPEAMYATAVHIVPGVYLLGAGITSPVQVIGYGTLTPCATSGFPLCGTYTIANPGSLSVSSETMTLSGIQAGGAIAPGAALTVSNPGVGAGYPVTNWSALTGTLPFSGTYNTGLLGGTPSAIQAQVSSTPNGPALSGCTPCAWTTLSSATISGGNWSGSLVNIPAGGPYWISFRAANGTSYATLPNSVLVGATIAGFGEGNAADQVTSNTAFTINQGYFQGLASFTGWGQIGAQPSSNESGSVYLPAIYLNSWAPSYAPQILTDPYGVLPTSSSPNDGAMGTINNASAVLGGVPINLSNMYKNGSGNQGNTYAGVTQTQTIGLGTGSQTVFSSGAAYGGTLNTSGGALASTLAGVTISTAGAMVVPGSDFPSGGWAYLNIGQAVTCATCLSGGPYSGIIMGGSSGSGGTYTVSPSPGSAIGSSTVTVTHNNLEFNEAWGSGAQIVGSVTSGVLTVGSVAAGVMAPLLIVTDPSSNAATLTGCLTGCSLLGNAQPGSTWQLSSGALNGDSSLAMSVEPPSGPLWPAIAPANSGPIPVTVTSGGTGFIPLIQVGTFQVIVGGTAQCADTNTFAYNIQVGAISGSGCSGWVNYVTGSYAITFGSAPASNAPVVAEWTNIMSTNSSGANEQIDYMGTTASNGGLASVAAQTGGVNAYLFGSQPGTSGWPDGSLNIARTNNYYFGTQMATLPHGLTNQPLLLSGMWNGMGVEALQGYFSYTTNILVEQYDQDAARLSNFSGTISSPSGSGPWTAKLTLSGAATGTMWEGEALECNPYSAACVLPVGTEIVGLDSSSATGWGTSGSVYDLTTDINGPFPSSGTCVGSACAIHNAMYYTPGNAAYVGPYNDLAMANGGSGGYAVETGGGMTGALRYGQRIGIEIGAALAGTPGLGSPVTLDRTIFTGCDAAAVASPCLDVGSTYIASHAATWSGSTFTITGGLSAGSRPFVPGMLLSCSGCNSGLIALQVSLPPTQSSATGAGQVGQTFSVTASGNIGGGGSGTLTGGCSGTSGTGSNCIDFKFDINTTGTYGTSAALNTCGVNNLQGTNTSAYNAGTYLYANGNCVPTGTGAFVRGFRIGSAQITGSQSSNLGSAYDTGIDPGTGAGLISQNEAFTCNIVAATIVQCVKGPTYANGLFSSVGQWSTGATFASYGDPNNAFSFQSGLIGYPGGQAFPVTAGSSYSPTGNYVTGGNCTLTTGAGVAPMAPAMGFTVSSGGAIINPYPVQVGNAINEQCSFPISFTFTAASIAAGTGHVNMVVNSGQPTGGNTIVPGEVLSGTGIASGTTVVSGPLIGTNGTYVINCPTACLSEVTDTVTSGPTAGSGGSITNPPLLWSTGSLTPDGTGGIDSYDSDINMTGDGLYDNSGVSGNPLGGKFNTPNGNLEAPGLPVKPFGMALGAQVGG